MSTIPLISQLKSLWQAVTGDTSGAISTQQEFSDAWEHHPGQQISDIADNIPIVGHVKGLVHLALCDTEAAIHSEEAATRTLAVIGAGALTAGTGGAATPILAGVVAGVVADAAITGIESVRHQKYEPQGYLGAVSELQSDWRGGLFDIVALGMGDAVLGADGSVTKTEFKTTKVFRVEGEGIFLTKRGMVEHGANSRIFSGPGGSVIESPNILKLMVPPDEEEKPVKFKRPAVLCLNVGDASRAETYYAQKLLQYREAAEKLRNDTDAATSKSHPTAFHFKIKSFRILSNDAERMFRDVPQDGDPSPTGVRRVDITKTSKSFECPQSVYTPLLEKVIPDTFQEAQPTWLLHLPPRFLEAMRDHQIAYGRVRTFVIVTSKFTKLSLISNIQQNITDQEFKRLEHGPVSLSILSQQGIDSVDVRMEPVRRLRQSREVKCGRKVVGDIDHGRHMEYLAEFSDGSTSWILSRNVALDLKLEYWNVMTTSAKEVTEIVNSDFSTGKVTVKRADGTTEVIDQTKIFWQQEATPTRLSDAELDALLYHSHFGFDARDFIPCTVTINTDWAKVEIQSASAAFTKDPAADKADEYAGVQFDAGSIQLGKEQSYKFVSRDIPLFIANNGSPFDIRVTHGADASSEGDRRGNVVLSLPDERFESHSDQANIQLNTSTFHIRPVILTAGLLSVESDWGAIEINSRDATISRDPTVDQGIYKNVTFTPTTMKLVTGVFDQKFVIPFVFLTRDEKIDITITHGLDKSHHDQLGQASALFGQKTYTSPRNPGNTHDNPKSFTDCKVNGECFTIIHVNRVAFIPTQHAHRLFLCT
ncbi:hypothetical protein ARMGADRAFT_1101061 [Armillaria gallica]|uniref:Uncharacterized protein n=1 Tax=Armillaria gallica TaxID=47427 RepID=A0A2H3DTJ7_ARMGA|nr:hypothetical protein ARMGADRAFT_1101061 [Armillaria gallica]